MTNGTEQSECTNMDCSGEAVYAYWMPDLGHFSEVRSPEHDQLKDGDLAPYVCESCRDRMAAGPHWDADRFVDPRERLVADGGTFEDGSDRSLGERIREKLLVDDPDETTLVDALDGDIEIVEGNWSIRLKDGFDEREPKDQVFTYLLGKYAAARVSDGAVPMSVSRKELYEHFDRKLVKDVCEHGWVRHWDGQVQIRPRFYKHTADELAAKYADRSLHTVSEQERIDNGEESQ